MIDSSRPCSELESLNNYRLHVDYYIWKAKLKHVIPSQGNNPAAPLTPYSTVMPSTSCKHGKE